MRLRAEQLSHGSFTLAFVVILFWAGAVGAQTAFTYQGRLTDGGTPANGNYDLQFTLWDMLSDGIQQPQPAPVTVTRNALVTNGVFTVQLDFGTTAFPGADRYLEIIVRKNAGDPFVTLSPRQQVTSTPYAVRSLTATNATQLEGVPASGFIQNTTTTQTGANFNIDGNAIIGGNGTVAGTLSASNAGVGTTTPSEALEVVGNAKVSGAGNGVVFPDGTKQTTASGAGGVSGSGTANTVPLWTGSTALGNSVITQASGNVGIGITPCAGCKLDVNGQALIRPGGSGGGFIGFGNPNGETGLTINGGTNTNRADIRSDNSTLKLLVGSPGGPPPSTNGIVIGTSGNVGIGTSTLIFKLNVDGGSGGIAVNADSNGGTGVYGRDSGGGEGVHGFSASGTGVTGQSNSGFGVFSNGFLGVSTLGVAGSTPLCRNASQQIASCQSSSLRYKTDLHSFAGGLSIINRLRPITFSSIVTRSNAECGP